MVRTNLKARLDYNQRKHGAQSQIAREQQRRPMRAPGMGVKNIERIVRKRRFKIKRMMDQPKNIEVKKTVE